MHCPVDNVALVMTDRQGIEIDYCPQCRGVWLDRGELDKLIERSAGAPAAPAGPSRPRTEEYQSPDYSRSRDHDRRDGDDYHGGHDKHHKKHKREGFLGDLFDF